MPEGSVVPKIKEAALNGTPENYLSFNISIPAVYIANGVTDFGTQLANTAGTIEHETQHVELHMQSLSTSGVRERPHVHHDAILNTSSTLYEDRANMYRELKPFWNKTFEGKQKQGWTQKRFINFNINNSIR